MTISNNVLLIIPPSHPVSLTSSCLLLWPLYYFTKMLVIFLPQDLDTYGSLYLILTSLKYIHMAHSSVKSFLKCHIFMSQTDHTIEFFKEFNMEIPISFPFYALFFFIALIAIQILWYILLFLTCFFPIIGKYNVDFRLCC